MDELSQKAETLKLSSNPPEVGGVAEPAPSSKKGQKKAAKQAEKDEKNRRKAEAGVRLAAEKIAAEKEDKDLSEGQYGNLPLIQSTSRTGIAMIPLRIANACPGEKRSRIADFNADLDGAEIVLRARVHNLRLGVYFPISQG